MAKIFIHLKLKRIFSLSLEMGTLCRLVVKVRVLVETSDKVNEPSYKDDQVLGFCLALIGATKQDRCLES